MKLYHLAYDASCGSQTDAMHCMQHILALASYTTCSTQCLEVKPSCTQLTRPGWGVCYTWYTELSWGCTLDLGPVQIEPVCRLYTLHTGPSIQGWFSRGTLAHPCVLDQEYVAGLQA